MKGDEGRAVSRGSRGVESTSLHLGARRRKDECRRVGERRGGDEDRVGATRVTSARARLRGDARRRSDVSLGCDAWEVLPYSEGEGCLDVSTESTNIGPHVNLTHLCRPPAAPVCGVRAA